jgi:hypothetical protein
MAFELKKNQKKEYNVTTIDKFVTWVILIFIPLSTYATPLQGVTVGDIILVFCIFFVLIDILKKHIALTNIVCKPLFIFSFFIFIHTCIYWLFDSDLFDVAFLSVSRYILYLFAVMLFVKYYFNKIYGIKIYTYLALVFTCYIIVQFVAFDYFKIILPTTFFGLPSYAPVLEIESYLSYFHLLYRPRCVFVEPAHFVVYQSLFLYVVLNSEIYIFRKRYILAAFITLGIIISGSTTGIAIILFCWFKTIRGLINITSLKSLLLTMFLTLFIIWTFHFEYIQKIIERFWKNDSFTGHSVVGRFGNYPVLFDDNIPFLQKIFGQGFGFDINFYLPSYGTLFLYLGYIGLIVFVIMMLHAYLHASKDGKGFILLLLMICIGTNALFGITSVLFFTLIYSEVEPQAKRNRNSS